MSDGIGVYMSDAEHDILAAIVGCRLVSGIVDGGTLHVALRAMRAERARCRRIVSDRIDGGTDAGRHISDANLTEMIREIEGGKS